MTGKWVRISLFFVPAAIVAMSMAAYTLSRLSPSSEPRAAPFGSALAPLRHADQRLPADLADVDTKKLHDIGLQSLKSEPLNPRALRMLALHSRAQEEPADTWNLISLSQELSRRDGTTQLLIIEAIANQPEGSVSEIVGHYDTILRVNPKLRERLFPGLVQLIADDEAAGELIPYVKEQAPWVRGLLRAALATDHGAEAMAEVLIASYPDGDVIIPEGYSSRLFEGLLKQGKFQLMKQLFLRMEDTEPAWLTSLTPGLLSKQAKYGPMVGQLNTTPDFGAELARGLDENNPALRFFSLAGSRGIAMTRVLFLRPGSYRLDWEIDAVETGLGAELTMDVLCMRAKSGSFDVEPIAKIEMIDIEAGTANFAVHDQCDVQVSTFSVAGGDRQSGLEAQLNKLALIKLD